MVDRAGRLLTIGGVGGMGKTRLALTVGRQVTNYELRRCSAEENTRNLYCGVAGEHVTAVLRIYRLV
ncbi:MAG: hypothetical protein DYG89_46090 [Caldilinea sp. CFX5]|nr:hypothetical protein [Caldilinea sp. CFX5]